MTSLKHHFRLDSEIVYLNHGAFGACPKPVFETYQARLRSRPCWKRGEDHF